MNELLIPENLEDFYNCNSTKNSKNEIHFYKFNTKNQKSIGIIFTCDKILLNTSKVLTETCQMIPIPEQINNYDSLEAFLKTDNKYLSDFTLIYEYSVGFLEQILDQKLDFVVVNEFLDFIGISLDPSKKNDCQEKVEEKSIISELSSWIKQKSMLYRFCIGRKFYPVFNRLCLITLLYFKFSLFKNYNFSNLSNDILIYSNKMFTAMGQLMITLIKFLQENPIGLKLNNELSLFLGILYKYHIIFWFEFSNGIMTQLVQVVDTVFTQYFGVLNRLIIAPMLKMSLFFPFTDMIPTITKISCLTLTPLPQFLLALVHDLTFILTLHIFAFYVYASKLYHLAKLMLHHLYLLFKGKKINPLRNRVDSCYVTKTVEGGLDSSKNCGNIGPFLMFYFE